MVIGAMMNTIFSANGIGGCLVIAGVISLADYIIRHPEKMLIHARNAYLIFIFTFSYLIFLKDFDPNEIYDGFSRNYLGLVLVLFHVFYCFLLYVVRGKLNFLFLIPSIVLAVTFVGRSSIGAIIFLLMVHLFVLFKSLRFIYKTLIITVIVLFIYKNLMILEQLYLMSSFNGHGLDTPRYEIWIQFFHAANFTTYIFGMDTFSVPIIAEYLGNVHNGFINILARTGIGFIFFLIVYICSLYRLIKYRSWFILSLLGILSFRAFFDTGIFIGNLGVCFYSLLLFPLSKNFILYNTKKIINVNDHSDFDVHDEAQID